MSAYTTLEVTRTKAQELYLREIFGIIPDGELEAFLDNKLEPSLHNSVVVPDEAERSDDALAEQILNK